MMNIKLRKIKEWIDCEIQEGYLDEVVQGTCIDSRKIEKSNLFIPFKGENVDGHRFVSQTLENGAGASFWQKDIPNPPKGPIIFVEDTLVALQDLAKSYLRYVNPKVVAITGSNGKTTTKDMVECVLNKSFKVKKTQGNYNNEIGCPLTILDLDEDTEVSILEMGMSGFGEIRELTLLAEPDVAIVTNIGESHMQDLGSREGIAKAKFEITEGLKDDGLFIYDGDEPLLKSIVTSINNTKVSVGTNVDNNVIIQTNQSTSNGINFQLNNSNMVYHLSILGEHNVKNATYAIQVAKQFGVTEDIIQSTLDDLVLTDMRMQRIETEKYGLLINDAYNASPTSMKAAIDTLHNMESDDKILILADVLELGDMSKEMHQQVGYYLEGKDIQTLITYGEEAAHISNIASEYIQNHYHFDSKEKITDYLKEHLNGESVTLFKGSRGMSLETIINSLT
ncbi:UDP-N-acetylmuramoyl-tripeptide--D-alanyl-D-alanine ligase [Mammaliicoccus fleurettii]|uniref:UDP-N-acetylmuramoyl-tripeptide--D-alanyl-D- alanine ligase n=1 Tax=Mammaliicoccus fleurettii TaxID=150056 RepID=UPI002DBD2FAD|nr:UDP-N-acetylmuramoyl-tripeptide--D-alanyl-D-alanine ligase [Mammaliicoccus fleurettii]MEB7780286.1 UDP-N-acetylmuramoyl-tripeptide--D-alanyl-D-alanine ligase [Mammaliicoccus fleurettii]